MSDDWKQEIERCWEALPLPEGTVRHLFAKRAGATPRGCAVTSLNQLTRVVERHRDDWNVYIQLNPSRRSSRHRTRASLRDVSHVQALLIDIDPVRDRHTDSLDADVALWLMQRGIAGGSWSIDTGRGRHHWIMFKDPIPVDSTMRWRVRQFVHDVAAACPPLGGCAVDTSCSDLPRLARLPGSINQKTGKMARMYSGCRSPVRPMEADWFLARPYNVPEVREQGEEIATGAPLRSFFHRLTQSALACLLDGPEEPGRHRALFALGASLREAGMGLDDAIGWAEKANDMARPEPLPQSEVARTVEQAYCLEE